MFQPTKTGTSIPAPAKPQGMAIHTIYLLSFRKERFSLFTLIVKRENRWGGVIWEFRQDLIE